jgi:hypothetical protein
VGPIAAIDVMVKRKISALVRIETLFVKPVVICFHESSKKNTYIFMAL